MAELDVAVIGAGISGLATAYGLAKAGREVQVFEAEPAVGGRMRTLRQDGYMIDEGTETIARFGYQSTWELLREMGLDGPGLTRLRSVVGMWRNGRPVPWVGHPLSGLTGAGLSFGARTRLNLAVGRLVAQGWKFKVDSPEQSPLGTQTIAEFAAARCGQESLDYMLQPAVGTGFGWDPARSTIAPLVAAMFATRGIFQWLTYRDGMDSLARSLAGKLSVHTSRAATMVKREGRFVSIEFAQGDPVTARSVVLAMPAPLIAGLHAEMPDDERPYLDACTYSTMIRISCLLDRPLSLARRAGQPRVYALLIARREDAVLSGLTIEHEKAANRSPASGGLISLLLTPALAREVIDLPDEDIAIKAVAAAEKYLPGVGTACRSTVVHRFRHAQPEATAQALRLRRQFLDRPARQIEYAGDWLNLRPQSEGAVASAKIAVPRVHAYLES